MTRERYWLRSFVFGLVIPAVVFAGPPSSRPAAPAPLTPEKLFEQTSGAVGKVLATDGRNVLKKQGSGFLVSADGLLVTNAHVVAGAKGATVEFPGGKPLRVVGVVAASETNDIVILKVDANDLPFLKLSTAVPKQGQKVYAIGNPRGLTNTISDGLVSGIREVAAGITVLQISVPIAPGSSGGPLLDASGVVVGVTSAGIGAVGNLNFAVPASVIADLLGKTKSPVPLAEAGVRVARTTAVPKGEPEPPKIDANRKADGMTVAKGAMRAFGELVLKKEKLTQAQVEEQRQSIAKTVEGAELTFALTVADVSFDEAKGMATVTFASPKQVLVIDKDKREVRWADKAESGEEIVSWVTPLTLPITKEQAAMLSKGSLLKLDGPALGILPLGLWHWSAQDQDHEFTVRHSLEFCLRLGTKHRGATSAWGPDLTINVPRFRVTVGSRVLYADPWLAEKNAPQATTREQRTEKPKE